MEDVLVINGVRYVPEDLVLERQAAMTVIETEDECINMTETAKLWGCGRDLAQKIVRWMRANDIEIGFKRRGPWMISKKKALASVSDGTFERSYNALEDINMI